MAESTDDESSNPWAALLTATIAFAVAAFFLFGEEIGAVATVPQEEALTTSRGIIIAIERRQDDADDMSVRLSDSTRWYVVSPYAERHEARIERELRRAKPGAVVAVLHDREDLGPEPTDGSRWYVVAFGMAIDGRDILTYADVLAGRATDRWVSRGMAALLGLWGAAYVVLAFMQFFGAKKG
jgi:hypothetical protein